MKPYVWNGEKEITNNLDEHRGYSPDWLGDDEYQDLVKEIEYLRECKDGAYWERNILAVLLAKALNDNGVGINGWYVHGEWVGWTRVVSLLDGSVTFHVPDDFDLGDLPQIDCNYDGHSTEEKWEFVMSMLGMKVDKDED